MVEENERSIVHWVDSIFEFDDRGWSLSTTDRLAIQSDKIKDVRVQVKDAIAKVDLGNGNKSRSTYFTARLKDEQKEQLISYFTWDYTKMPQLDRKLVEHKIPLKLGLSHTRYFLSDFLMILCIC
ncbi:hypothetical protein ACH5RR_025594 [Cinchona calisaya]|uniref:Uncharacterized protein n=1 Tax=Cinchona calisaya TaxID=153742 RepID=A0ABD2Z032_9GENT